MNSLLPHLMLSSLFALLVTGCGGSGGSNGGDTQALKQTPTPRSELTLKSFDSCDSLRDYYAEALTLEYTTAFWAGEPCWGCDDAVALEGDATSFSRRESTFENDGMAENAVAAPSQDRDNSSTNTQEEGVDQADLIEVDAATGHLFVLNRQQRELLVVKAVPAATMEIVARVALDTAGFPQGLYFDETNRRLVVAVSGGFTHLRTADSIQPPQRQSGTELYFYNVASVSSPVLINRFWTEGNLVDSRRIDDRVHLVTRYQFGFPAALNSNDFQTLVYNDYQRVRRNGDEQEITRLAAEIERKVNEAVANTPLNVLLPRQESGNEATVTSLDCAAIERPDVPNRLGMLQITSIDTDGSNANTLATINNSWMMYASQQNIYLIQSSRGWWFDQSQQQQTAIYRFEIDNASRSAVPAGFGLVDGWVNNSFSLSEHEQHLRVATTVSRLDSSGGNRERSNDLTVLSLNNRAMPETGSVRGYGPDERIFSARFLEERGFVVTFRQTDPLFAFDLSDPNNPILEGELEIPGFSTYIHPLGDDHLLTIGRAGGENGLGVGNSFQLQIFDVSDLANPLQSATAQPDLGEREYAYSLAEYEPLAFTYLESANLLSIPAQISSNDESRALTGFMAYDVDPATGINELSRIDHRLEPDENQNSGGCPPGRADEPGIACSSFAPIRWNEPLRSAILRNFEPGKTVLYTVSDELLIATEVNGNATMETAKLSLGE